MKKETKVKSLKKQVKGITLIALVVTIVVLLILAGVAISLTIGSNGIFTRAENAVDRYEIASTDEQDEMNKAVNFLDKYLTGGSNPGENPEDPGEEGEDKKVSEVVGGAKFEQTETIKDDNGKGVTIPKGFSVHPDSNTVVDDGIVITDGTNEFVWVPVDDPSTMFTEIPEGEEPARLTGVTTQTNIYSKLRVRAGDSFTAGAPGTSGIREPDVLSNYDTSSSYYGTVLGFGSTKDMADSMVAEYKAMSKSVKKYNGFYIGRYELTGDVDNPTEKAGDVLTAEEAGNWYGLYKACQNVIKNNSEVKSTMIYGCQWDETMSWLKNTKFKGQEDKVDSDSSSWGVYRGDGGPVQTGSVSRCEANEIYDLAGNYFDWTQEAYSTSYRIYRGGNYNNSGSSLPASDSYTYNPSSDYSDSASRATLYIL